MTMTLLCVGGPQCVESVTGRSPALRRLELVQRTEVIGVAERKSAKKGAKPSATRKTSTGFTDEERAAMKERAAELKATARRGSRAGKADGESDLLAKIAELPDPDR